MLFDIRTAIASYDSAAGALPTSSPFNYSVACVDEPYGSLRPVVPWVIESRPANNITRDRFSVLRQNPGEPAEDYQPGGYQHWEFTSDFLWINFEEPTILNTTYQGVWDPHYHILEGMDIPPRASHHQAPSTFSNSSWAQRLMEDMKTLYADPP